MPLSRLFCLALLLLPGFVAAQPETRPLVVMNLAAHPDDEDGRTLTYYRNAENAIAYSVIYTRGEGGQNEIGPDLYEKLGALRTEETERAARLLGTQVFFLNFKDFGYSKFAHEAFDAWGGRDNVTARLVYLVRKLKPDLLFTNHDTVTVGARQHGQHQAVGLSAWDAMHLAADPSYHPEQLAEPGVDLWQPKRLFLRYWRAPEGYDVALPVGNLRGDGVSHSEVAARAIAEHASQGMGNFVRGRFGSDSTYFALLFDAGQALHNGVDLAGHLPPNTAAQPDLRYWIDSGRVPTLPAGALRLSDSVVIPGDRLTLRWQADTFPAGASRLRLHGSLALDLDLPMHGTNEVAVPVPADATPTLPKHVRQYDRFVSTPPVAYRVEDAAGEVIAAGYLPLDIAPSLYAEPATDVVRLRTGPNTLPVQVQSFGTATEVFVTAEVLNAAGAVVASERTRSPVPTDARRGQQVFVAAVPVTLSAVLPAGAYPVRLTVQAGSETATAEMQGRVFDVAVAPGLKVGIVQSYDDTMQRAMDELGVDYRMLTPKDLAAGRFDDLHTIVVDIRAYLVREDLRRNNQHLLDWVEDGGHLVVNYQKTFEWNPGTRDPFDEALRTPDEGFAPYPLVLGRQRVTYEDAPVTLLNPDHTLLHAPNAVQSADWDGWVQERGLYFPQRYDEAYTELFAMNDPGEAPLSSSTLLATYGAGTYLYTALGWYRQLKQFHPGAYRVFANLISLPLVDGRPGTD